ncbi:MAG: QcrA and Rieske domain-containing protein [Chloroflexota bacterium]
MTERTTQGPRVDRRGFFQRAVAAIAAAFAALLGIPLLGFFASALFRRPPEDWARVCSLDEIRTDAPTQFRVIFPRRDGFREYDDVRGVFVIRRGDDILAFTNICTHMGCSVRWLDWRQQILCPCHGGMYDRWGNLVGGPPARSLPLYVSRIEGNDLYVANRIDPQERRDG